MSGKFHNYKFKIKRRPFCDELLEYHKIRVCCKKSDNEIYLYSINGGGDYSLYLQDRFFNLNIANETKNVSAFEGDLVRSKLQFVELSLSNKIEKVILSLDTKDDLPKGFGGYIPFNGDDILYDKRQKILQIGKYDSQKPLLKFLNNAYAQLTEDRHLVCILIAEIS